MSQEAAFPGLDRFRSYLLLLAQVRLDPKLKGKLDASDSTSTDFLSILQRMGVRLPFAAS